MISWLAAAVPAGFHTSASRKLRRNVTHGVSGPCCCGQHAPCWGLALPRASPCLEQVHAVSLLWFAAFRCCCRRRGRGARTTITGTIAYIITWDDSFNLVNNNKPSRSSYGSILGRTETSSFLAMRPTLVMSSAPMIATCQSEVRYVHIFRTDGRDGHMHNAAPAPTLTFVRWGISIHLNVHGWSVSSAPERCPSFIRSVGP